MTWHEIHLGLRHKASILEARGFQLREELFVRQEELWQCVAVERSSDKSKVAIELGFQPLCLLRDDLQISGCEFNERVRGWQPIAELAFEPLWHEIMRAADLLDSLRRFEDILAGLSPDDLVAGKVPPHFEGGPERIAWICAKHYEHVGRSTEAQRYARAGLQIIKGPVGRSLRRELQRLAHAR